MSSLKKAKHDAVAAELEQVKARIAELEGAASSMTRFEVSTQRARIQIVGMLRRKAFARLLKPNPTIADLEQADISDEADHSEDPRLAAS